MVAAGHQASGFANISQAARSMASAAVENTTVLQPRNERHQAYQSLYDDYRKLAAAIRSL
jgi:sugar (pentulose or hexulose) kinase